MCGRTEENDLRNKNLCETSEISNKIVPSSLFIFSKFPSQGRVAGIVSLHFSHGKKQSGVLKRWGNFGTQILVFKLMGLGGPTSA